MPARKEDKNRGASSGAGGRRGGKTSARVPLSPSMLGALAALAAVLLYLPAMPYGWVWDDSVLLATKGLGGAGTDSFRPISSLLYRTEWLVGLGNVGLYHLTSILLHAVATWLVFLFARRLGAASWIAFGAALLFAAHPVHVEAVAYVSGRPDLLATLFALASLLVATSAPVCAPGGCRNWRVWPAYGLFALAALSEEAALVTPFVLVLLDRVANPRRTWRERRVVYAGFFGVLVATLLWRLGEGQLHLRAHGEVPAGAALAAPFVALFDGMRALVVPWHLNALRYFPESLAPGAIVWRAALPLVLLALFVWWRRNDPLARAGAILLALPLIPALPLPPFEGSYLMDRALYFASVGFCFLAGSAVGWLAERIPGGQRAGIAVTVATAALLALVTLARIPVWRDNVTLLQAATKADPTDPKPQLLLAEHYVAAGDPTAALAAVERALAVDSTNADAYHKKTAVLILMDQFPRAEAAARKSVSLDPKDAIGWANLGDVLLRQGKTDEAIAAARRAVALDSTSADNWYNLGVVLGNQADLSEAIEAYRRVIAINPQHAQAVNNMGALLGASGRLEEARDAYKRAVELTPNAVECRMNLALAYLRLGDKAAAEEQRKVIQRLDPAAASKLPEIFLGSSSVSGSDSTEKVRIRIDPHDARVVP